MWEHNISVSGGNEKLNYYLSGNTVDQTGIFRQNPDKYKVYNFRSKISARIAPMPSKTAELLNEVRYTALPSGLMGTKLASA